MWGERFRFAPVGAWSCGYMLLMAGSMAWDCWVLRFLLAPWGCLALGAEVVAAAFGFGVGLSVFSFRGVGNL